MSDIHKATLEKANAAIAGGDYEGFLSFCTEDTVWSFVGDTTLRGKAAVREWMARTYTKPPNFKVCNLIAEADFVAALGEIVLQDNEGNAVRHKYCDVWRFRDGKMDELQAFVMASDER